MEQISTDTLKTSLEVVGRIIPLFIWCISGLCVAVVAMATYIVWHIKNTMKMQKESTIVISKNNLLIENNNKLFERTFDYITKK